MSFDLLAEFGESASNDTTANKSRQAQENHSSSAFDDLNFFETSSVPSKSPNPAQHTNQNDDIWGDLSSFASSVPKNTPKSAATSDPWGNLSGISSMSKTSSKIQPPIYTYNESVRRNPSLQKALESGPAIARSRFTLNDSNPPVETNIGGYQRTAGTSNIRTKPVPTPLQRNENVLFDAEDQSEEGEDDDFGDFETVDEPSELAPPILQPNRDQERATHTGEHGLRRPPGLSLLNASNVDASTLKADSFPYPQAPLSPAFQERNPFTGMKITTPTATPTQAEHPDRDSPVTAWPTFESKPPTATPYHDSPAIKSVDDDDWGDFADLPETPAVHPPSHAASVSIRPTDGIEADAWCWDAADAPPLPAPVPKGDVALPPSNIPPPSILLSIFPQLFDLPNSPLFQAMSNQPTSVKTKVLSDPVTLSFLRGYLLLATVAARVVAGRKLRWKRDSHLAQSMSIGGAGGKGGMKLTNIDKTENTREEREAADVVRIWKDQVGRLRSVVATANQNIQGQGGHLIIPDINEVMPIRTANSTEGALTAPKACIVCGLKRVERVTKVDVDVEDSFGEWWVDHWGHRACKNFWQEHEAKLKSR